MTRKQRSPRIIVAALGMLLAWLALAQPTMAQSLPAADALVPGNSSHASNADARLRPITVDVQPTGF